MRRFAPLVLGISLSFGQTQEPQPEALKRMTLEQLSQLEVTTPSKEPVRAFQTPAAIFVITRAVNGVLRATNEEDPVPFGKEQLEDELVKLVRCYLYT